MRIKKLLILLSCMFLMMFDYAIPISADNAGGEGIVHVQYKYGGNNIDGAEFSIAQVGSSAGGKFEFSGEAKSKLDGESGSYSNDEMTDSKARELAERLASDTSCYDVISTKETDSSGMLSFSGLDDGIYLVWQSGSEGLSVHYADAKPFLVSFPYIDDAGAVQREITAYPKTDMNKIETMVIKGKIEWRGDTTSIRPKQVRIHLLANGKEIDSIIVSASDGWKYEFDNIPLTDSEFHEYTFSISEDPLDGYTYLVSKKIGDKVIEINIINKYMAKIKTGVEGNWVNYLVIAGIAFMILVFILSDEELWLSK